MELGTQSPIPIRFDRRLDQQEIMDDLAFDGKEMDKALRELEVINKWLGGNQLTLHGLDQLTKTLSGNNPLRIVDLGCGGGDMLKLIANKARKRNRNCELIGIDANPYIIEYAKSNTKDYPEISYQAINIFSQEFQKQQFDIILCTLFTHHFTDHQLVQLLSQMKHQMSLGLVINDLHRHRLAYYSIKLLTRLFSRSYMVKNDGPISVLRGFSRSNWQSILEQAAIKNYSLNWRWAFRWELVIPPPSL